MLGLQVCHTQAKGVLLRGVENGRMERIWLAMLTGTAQCRHKDFRSVPVPTFSQNPAPCLERDRLPTLSLLMRLPLSKPGATSYLFVV